MQVKISFVFVFTLSICTLVTIYMAIGSKDHCLPYWCIFRLVEGCLNTVFPRSSRLRVPFPAEVLVFKTKVKDSLGLQKVVNNRDPENRD